MSQEIALYNRIQNPMEAVQQMGKPFAVMFGLQSEAQGMFLALASMAENKTPFDIVRTYDILNDGKLRKKALAIYAEFRARGGRVKWISTGKDGKKAEAEFTFEDQTIVESFTIEEAKQQNLIREKSNWIKTPANMLRARVLSNAIAMLCPEIVAGVSGSPEDDADENPRPEKQIFATDADPQAAPEAAPAPAPAAAKPTRKPKAETIIDVPAANEPAEQPPQAAQSAPVNSAPAPAAAPAPSPMAQAEVDRKTGLLTPETLAALEDSIPLDKQEKVLRWLETKGWIKPKGSLLDLKLNRAQAILADTPAFLKHIGA